MALAIIPMALVAAGCTEQDEPEVPEVPGETETLTGTPAPTGTGDPTAQPTDAANVPFECGDMLTAGQVVQILQTSLDGRTERVYNDDHLEESGRTGRLTCSYGVPTGDGATRSPSPSDSGPAVQIAVNSYIDEETAAGRIDTTLGATSRDVDPQTISGREGYLLTGEGEVTFIVADGVRTYVVTLRRGVVSENAEPVVILDLAAEVLGLPEPTSSPES